MKLKGKSFEGTKDFFAETFDSLKGGAFGLNLLDDPRRIMTQCNRTYFRNLNKRFWCFLRNRKVYILDLYIICLERTAFKRIAFNLAVTSTLTASWNSFLDLFYIRKSFFKMSPDTVSYWSAKSNEKPFTAILIIDASKWTLEWLNESAEKFKSFQK